MNKDNFNKIEMHTEKEIVNGNILGKSYILQTLLLVFVQKGNLSIVKNTQKRRVEAGTLFFIRPESVFELERFSDDLKIKIVSTDLEYMSEMIFEFSRYELYKLLNSRSISYYTLPKKEVEQLSNLFQVLYYSIENEEKLAFSFHFKNAVYISIIYFIADIIFKHKKSKDKQKSRKEEIVMLFLRYLSQHFRTHRKLSFYADLMQLSTRHLSSTLKEVTGYTANELIHQAVIAEAKVLLTSTNRQINDISEELNFNDQYYFSHFFKKYTDMNPSDFRNKLGL